MFGCPGENGKRSAYEDLKFISAKGRATIFHPSHRASSSLTPLIKPVSNPSQLLCRSETSSKEIRLEIQTIPSSRKNDRLDRFLLKHPGFFLLLGAPNSCWETQIIQMRVKVRLLYPRLFYENGSAYSGDIHNEDLGPPFFEGSDKVIMDVVTFLIGIVIFHRRKLQ